MQLLRHGTLLTAIFISYSIGYSTIANAQVVGPPAPAPVVTPPNPVAEDSADPAVPAPKKESPVQNLGGLGFGTGLSLTVDLGSEDRVSDAEVVAGIVRVKEVNNARARVMLESHYFFGDVNKKENGTLEPYCKISKNRQCGLGFFVAVQPGSNDIIDAIAVGVMVGFARISNGSSAGKSSSAFNLGIGVVVDPSVKVLGDGIEANKPLPTGETSVRFKTISQTGLLFLTSFSF